MNWKRVRLKEIAAIVMGQSPPGDTYNEDGSGLPFFQGKADFGVQHPTPRKWCSAPIRIAEPGDILLSVRAPVGPTNLTRETSCIGRGLAAVRVLPRHAIPRFVLYYLKYIEPILSVRANGSTFGAIGRSNLDPLEVPLPPIGEQRRIVEILDQADRLRRLRVQADTKAARVLRALFIKLFEGADTNWPVRRLGSLLRPQKGALQSGPFGSNLHNSDFVQSGSVLAVGIDNVLDGEFVLGRNRRITSDKYNELMKYTLEKGDVLITIMGTVGRTCVFPGKPSPAICTKHVYRLKLNDAMDPEYLSATLRFSDRVRAQLGARVTGQIVSGITSADLRRLEVSVPPMLLQAEFAKRKREIDDIRHRANRVGSTCDALYDQLTRLAFAGRLTASWRDSRTKELLYDVGASDEVQT